MNVIWKTSNLIVLVLFITFCLLGTFYKQFAFGWGLGDVLWYLLMYLTAVTHLILTFISRNKSVKRHKYLTIIFLIITFYIYLQATLWRGIEYPWNGEVFYKNEKLF